MASEKGELWGIVEAVNHTLTVWPWLGGIGVRCDNDAAVRAVAGCDARGGELRGNGPLQPARKALAHMLRGAGVLARATHVRGHGRADLDRQKAFNGHADHLARRAARRINEGRNEET